jgi:exonuclease III
MGWKCWWYSNNRIKRQYNNKKQGGVAIWIKQTSSRRPDITIENTTKIAGGRFMSIQLKWTGHKLQIGCAYLPNRQSETFKIIEEHLLGVVETAIQENRQIMVW